MLLLASCLQSLMHTVAKVLLISQNVVMLQLVGVLLSWREPLKEVSVKVVIFRLVQKWQTMAALCIKEK